MCEIIFKILYSLALSFGIIIVLDNIAINKIRKMYWLTNIFMIPLVYFILFSQHKFIFAFLIFLLVVIVSFYNFRRLTYSMFISCISLIIMVLSYFIVGFLVDILTKEQKQVLDILSYQYIIIIIGTFFFGFFLSILIKGLFVSLNINKEIFAFNSPNRVLAIVIFFILIVTVIMDGFVFLIIGNNNEMTIVFTFRNISRLIVLLNVIFIFICVMFNVIILFFNNKNFEAKLKKDFTNSEIKRLKEYTGMIENIYDDLRRFRHDYFNILEVIQAYIENEDIKGLKRFYNDELIPESEKLHKNNKSIYMLKNILIGSLKGLLSSKIIKAQGLGIDTYVEIVDEIDYINMSEIDLCRIVGVFLDNAIEASLDVEKPFIKIYIIKKEKVTIIVINNRCHKNTPPVYKIYEKGFSSKGKNRGLGLYNVKTILDQKYPSSNLSTSIKEDVFSQELIISKDNN